MKATAPTRLRRKSARLQPEDRIADIMVAARQVLLERGSEKFLPVEVAERCGISEATIYRYFPTKRDLLIRVAEAWFEEILDAVPDVAQQEDVREQLRLVIWHSLQVVRKAPALSRYVLMDLRSDPNYRGMRIYELNRRFTASISEVVRGGVARGIFRDDVSLRLVRDMVFGAIEHQTWAYLRGQGDFSVDDVAESITGMIYRGLLAERPRRDRSAIAAAMAQIEAGGAALVEGMRSLKSALRAAGSLPETGRLD